MQHGEPARRGFAASPRSRSPPPRMPSLSGSASASSCAPPSTMRTSATGTRTDRAHWQGAAQTWSVSSTCAKWKRSSNLSGSALRKGAQQCCHLQ